MNAIKEPIEQEMVRSGSSEAIGKRVKELRTVSGMTQKQLAEKIYRTREWVNKIERGAGDLKTGSIIDLAKALDTTCDYLLTGISSENVDIAKATGLSDVSINMIKYNAPVRQFINNLLGDAEGQNLLFEIDRFLKSDIDNIIGLDANWNEVPVSRIGCRITQNDFDLGTYSMGFFNIKNAVELSMAESIQRSILNWKRSREEQNAKKK